MAQAVTRPATRMTEGRGTVALAGARVAGAGRQGGDLERSP